MLRCGIILYCYHKFVWFYFLPLSLPHSLPPSSSSQDTLEEASALLKEIEARDSRQVPQATSDNKQPSETSDELSSNTQQSNLDRLEG